LKADKKLPYLLTEHILITNLKYLFSSRCWCGNAGSVAYGGSVEVLARS